MKFLCVPCDTPMKLQTVAPPDRGSLSVVYACPECGYEIAMLTNAYETQVVQSLGVRIGPSTPLGAGSIQAPAHASPAEAAGPDGPAAKAGCPFSAMIPGMDGHAASAVSGEPGPVRWTAAAEARLEFLSRHFPGRTEIIHGRMKGSQKDEIMRRFQTGDISILVSTTVIEVGVDVPEATIMIIENAERFGLAQLHQLRGRVGRGEAKSSCILLYAPPLTTTAKARLEIMRETDDGFLIAEEDLRLRGAGEALGTRQSGLPQFRLADLSIHANLLPIAREEAQFILAQDPLLKSSRGQASKPPPMALSGAAPACSPISNRPTISTSRRASASASIRTAAATRIWTTRSNSVRKSKVATSS